MSQCTVAKAVIIHLCFILEFHKNPLGFIRLVLHVSRENSGYADGIFIDHVEGTEGTNVLVPNIF